MHATGMPLLAQTPGQPVNQYFIPTAAPGHQVQHMAAYQQPMMPALRMITPHQQAAAQQQGQQQQGVQQPGGGAGEPGGPGGAPQHFHAQPPQAQQIYCKYAMDAMDRIINELLPAGRLYTVSIYSTEVQYMYFISCVMKWQTITKVLAF